MISFHVCSLVSVVENLDVTGLVTVTATGCVYSFINVEQTVHPLIRGDERSLTINNSLTGTVKGNYLTEGTRDQFGPVSSQVYNYILF